MNDFGEIENELKKLRPMEASPELFARIEAELREAAAEEKIIAPERFRINWGALGVGLAAAAILLLFARLHFENKAQQPKVTSRPPSQSGASHSEATTARSTTPKESGLASSLGVAPAQFIPTGATQVVYRTEDEGLHFPTGSEQPVRRVRSRMRETVQWQNPTTGASLRVSYPSEEVTLLPVYGQ